MKNTYADMQKSLVKVRSVFRKIIVIIMPYFLATIVALFAYNLLADSVPEAYEENIFTTISGIVGTIVAIEFSMILLVVERISSKYSPKFLHYVLSNRIFIFSILYSIILIMFCLFPFRLQYISKIQIAMLTFSIFFVFFIKSLMETIRLMNPKESILVPETKSIKLWLNKELHKTEMEQKRIGIGSAAFKVSDSFEIQLEEKLLPIRDIIVRSIFSNNIQETTDGIEAFTEVALAYLSCRKNFIDDNDKFMFFIYSEFQNISLNAEKTGYLHLRIHPILISSLKLISKEALKVNVNRTRIMSSNRLIVFPVKGIYDLCIQNLKNQNSSAPSVACRALEEIGIFAIENEYVDEAASIVKNLSEISNMALEVGSTDLYFLSQQSNVSMMKIANNIAQNREALSQKYSLDYALMSIIDSAIGETIIKVIKRKGGEYSLWDPLTPFMCELYELREDGNQFNLANLIGNLIFSVKNPYLINESFDDIVRGIYFRIYMPAVDMIGNEERIRSRKYIDTVYLGQLVLMSIFNPKLRKELLGKEQEINGDLNRDKAIEAFNMGIGVLWRYFNSYDHQKYENDHTLDAIFSLMVIGILDENTDKNFAKRTKGRLLEMYKDYCSKQHSSQDTFFKYCRMFNRFAKFAVNEKKNMLTNIPKYEDKMSSIYSFRPGDNSLPFDNHSESIYFDATNSKQQWKLLGTYTIHNVFFDELNNKIWGD